MAQRAWFIVRPFNKSRKHMKTKEKGREKGPQRPAFDKAWRGVFYKQD